MTKLVAKVTSRTPVSVETVEEGDEGDPAGNSRRSLSIAFRLSASAGRVSFPQRGLDGEVSQRGEEKMRPT